MAKGKYATRAAKARADAARESAADLKALLESERLEHRATVADLKSQVQKLNGALTSSVSNLAKEEIQRARRDVRAVDVALAEQRLNLARAVDKILEDETAVLSQAGWIRLHDAFGVDMRELEAEKIADRDATGWNRSQMRRAQAVRDSFTERRRAGTLVTPRTRERIEAAYSGASDVAEGDEN